MELTIVSILEMGLFCFSKQQKQQQKNENERKWCRTDTSLSFRKEKL